jgi:hypothetical protein
MNKPVKPNRKIYITNSKTFYFDHVSNKVSLDFFLSWVKESLPKGSSDVTISLDEDYEYETGEHLSSYLSLSWKEKIINTSYDKDLIKYQKKLKKWKNEQCQK